MKFDSLSLRIVFQRFPGIALDELQDLDVLGGVHLHQLDQQLPEGLLPETLQFRGQATKFLGVVTFVSEQRLGESSFR